MQEKNQSKSVQKRIAAQKGLPDPFSRQEKIGRIYTEFLKWRKVNDPLGGWYWVDKTGATVAECSSDPFTNPSDTARVMDEVVARGYEYQISSPAFDGDRFCGAIRLRKGLPRFHRGFSDDSPWSAFCNAIYALIGAIGGER